MSYKVPEVYILKSPNNILEIIADYLVRKNKKDLSDICIVFPNKRPKLYLRKMLSEKLKSSYIPPSIFSLQEFANKVLMQMYPFEHLELLDAVYILREIFRKKEIDIGIKDRFSDFLPWGIRILKAIDELELNNVDFEKIKMYKQYAEVPERIKNILEILKDLKDEFYKEMEERKKFTRGYLYKNLKEVDFDLDYREIIFAGFYAFLPLEELFLKKIWEKCDTKIFFLETREKRAIYEFMKRNNLDYTAIKPLDYKPDIKFIKVKDYYAQAIFFREKLGEIKEKVKDPAEIGCILPSPDVLESVIGEVITAFKSDFNISMGYNFRLTPFFSFIKKFLDLKREIKDLKFYHRSLLSFLHHPFIVSIFSEEAREIEDKIRKLNTEKGRIYFELRELVEEKFDKDFVRILHYGMEKIECIKDFVKIMEDTLYLIFDKIKNGTESILFRVFFNESLGILERLKSLILADEEMDTDEIARIIIPYLSSYSIPLKGDPLRGVQILGVLEARLIPFKKIFFFDLIEGIYPKSYKYDPILPEGLRKMLGLPSYKENEAIYAYNFYQIVENAKEVYLIWYEKEEDVDSTESRFVQRILWEKEKEKRKLLYDEIPFISYNPVITKEERKIVKKDDRIMSILYKRAEEGIHITDLDTYLTCPFRFYQSVVLRNKEDKDISEEPDFRGLGSFLHDVLENFYRKNFMNKVPEWNDDMKREFIEYLSCKYDEKFGKEKETQWFRKEFLLIKMRQFVDILEQKDKGIVKELEVKIDHKLRVNEELTVKLKGKIDRIDEKSGYLRVIDYKSSKGELVFPVFPEEIKNRRSVYKSIRSLQVPVYSLLYAQLKGKEVKEGAYYVMKTPKASKEFEYGRKHRRVRIITLEETENILSCVLLEIFDKEVPFEPDSRTGNCTFCPYKGICGEF